MKTPETKWFRAGALAVVVVLVSLFFVAGDAEAHSGRDWSDYWERKQQEREARQIKRVCREMKHLYRELPFKAELPEFCTTLKPPTPPPPPTDVCPNIEGVQGTMPTGYELDGVGNCVPVPPPPTDVCPNLDGAQATIPDGYETNEAGDCVLIAPPPPPQTENTALLCADTLDNDNDALTDLADPDCVLFIPSEPEPGHVVVSEIAWMGYQGDANNEWMELHNPTASAVDLTGWALIASDGTPSVFLSGSIAAGGYYLLERSDDTSVPAVPADKIYTGALSNTSETLFLTNAASTTVDTIASGTNWADIGGSIATGETPQRTTAGTWVTAVPTPRVPLP